MQRFVVNERVAPAKSRHVESSHYVILHQVKSCFTKKWKLNLSVHGKMFQDDSRTLKKAPAQR